MDGSIPVLRIAILIVVLGGKGWNFSVVLIPYGLKMLDTLPCICWPHGMDFLVGLWFSSSQGRLGWNLALCALVLGSLSGYLKVPWQSLWFLMLFQSSFLCKWSLSCVAPTHSPASNYTPEPSTVFHFTPVLSVWLKTQMFPHLLRILKMFFTEGF
jgi:hypothetical protein